MRFREWLRLDELQHISLPAPLSINGVKVNMIDMRFEDWSKGLNPEKGGGSLMKFSPAQYIKSPAFSGKLDDGSYLNVIAPSSASVSGSGAMPLAEPKLQPSIDDEPKAPMLSNPLWWRYVIGYMNYNVVKEPEWPRDDSEVISKRIKKPVATRPQLRLPQVEGEPTSL